MLKHVTVGENSVETTYNRFPTGVLLLFDALLAVSQLGKLEFLKCAVCPNIILFETKQKVGLVHDIIQYLHP